MKQSAQALLWPMDVIFGTIGAYDYNDGSIEVGFSIVRACWGRGYATEALKAVLVYLTKNEGIDCVTAWFASKNTGSRRVLEKAGMKLSSFEGMIAAGWIISVPNGAVLMSRIYMKLRMAKHKDTAVILQFIKELAEKDGLYRCPQHRWDQQL